MKKQILFLPGGGEEGYVEDKLLADSLQAELGDGYQVHYPHMPEPDDPKFSKWSKQLAKELAGLDGPVILAGHSLGASVIVKYLAENQPPKPIAGVFLVSTPFWGEQLSDFMLAEDFADHLPPGLPIFLYRGSDDDTVPLSHLTQYREKLPQATAREVAGFDHQFNNDLSAVARDIEKL